jgi:hypothetical protein
VPLEDHHGDAVADYLRFDDPQVAALGLLLEDLPAGPDDHRGVRSRGGGGFPQGGS